jgi:DNA polymerase-1
MIKNYPVLTEDIVAIDLETKESQDLKKYGSSVHRAYLENADSYILGASISTSDNDYYFEACNELFEWLRSIQKDHLFVGHNILYDLAWLRYEGFIPSRVADTMGLVKMLHEDRFSYSLNDCGIDFLNDVKGEDELIEWCKSEGLKGKPQVWLWKMPFELVSKYAKQDTRLTYDLYMKLIPEIERQELTYIWGIECKFLIILMEVNHKGIRVDNDRRMVTSEELNNEIVILESWLFDKAGGEFKEGSGKQLAPIFDKLGIKYSFNKPTAKMIEKGKPGNPSFTSDKMLPYGIDPNMEYFPHVLVTYRKLRKLKKDFVDRLEDFMVCGRVHPTVNPYGTKTGRPSASKPNIFQIPKRGRGKEICRPLFIPEIGEEWVSMDYASEELRVFAHYARGNGADRYREQYNNNPKYDMHLENGLIAGCDRPKAKSIGLGKLFGMGVATMAKSLGVSDYEGKKIVAKFDHECPSFKITAKSASEWAKQNGFMRTISKRRRRFPRGEGSFKALNFLTQANSADIAKITIVQADEAGLLENLNLLLYLYDEYNFSVKKENFHYLNDFKKIGENAIKLNVKMALDLEIGTNWGDIKNTEWGELCSNV